MAPRAPSAYASLQAHNQGRDPRRLALKLAKMAANPFAFFRGACHRFYEELPVLSVTRDVPTAWICGDLHLENFGSYKGDNRLAYFDLNDFDEACLAPVTWDLVRFQASVFLGTALLGLGAGPAAALAARFTRRYAEVLAAGHARWVERRTARGAVRRLLRGLARRDQADLLDDRAPARRGRRRLRVGGEGDDIKALEAEPARRARIVAALKVHAKTLDRPQELRALDVQDRVAGTGSLGLPRYVILARGDGAPDGHWLLDAKAVPASAPARHAPCRQPAWPSEAERATTLQRRLQAVPPARLATLQVDATPYVLRELLPSEDRVDLARAARKDDRIEDLIEDMAQVVAWAHLRGAGRQGAAGPDELIAFGRDPTWHGPLLTLARRSAGLARRDHGELVAALRRPGHGQGPGARA